MQSSQPVCGRQVNAGCTCAAKARSAHAAGLGPTKGTCVPSLSGSCTNRLPGYRALPLSQSLPVGDMEDSMMSPSDTFRHNGFLVPLTSPQLYLGRP
jgi:hypothetical protein